MPRYSPEQLKMFEQATNRLHTLKEPFIEKGEELTKNSKLLVDFTIADGKSTQPWLSVVCVHPAEAVGKGGVYGSVARRNVCTYEKLLFHIDNEGGIIQNGRENVSASTTSIAVTSLNDKELEAISQFIDLFSQQHQLDRHTRQSNALWAEIHKRLIPLLSQPQQAESSEQMYFTAAVLRPAEVGTVFPGRR